MTVLTAELRRAVEQAGDEPVALTDPQTNTAYVLVRADVFQEMRELWEEERTRSGIARTAKRNAAGRRDAF